MAIRFFTPIITIVFLFTQCNTPKYVKKDSNIIYNVFDSLDLYFSKKVAEKKHVYVIIDPRRTPRCDLIAGAGGTLILVSLHEFDPNILKEEDKISLNSNRYLEIGGKLYHVYVYGLDEIFIGQKDTTKGRIYEKYGRPEPYYEYFDRVIVDLDKRVYYHTYDLETPLGRKQRMQ